MKLNPKALDVGLALVQDMRMDSGCSTWAPVDVERVARLGELAIAWRTYDHWLTDRQQLLSECMDSENPTLTPELNAELEQWFDDIQDVP